MESFILFTSVGHLERSPFNKIQNNCVTWA